VLISQEAVRQEAARRGVTVTDEEVDAYTRDRVREQFGVELELEVSLVGEGFDE